MSANLPEPAAWRYVPSAVWRDYVLTDDPKRAALAEEFGRPVESLFTAEQMQAAIAQARISAFEEAARLHGEGDVAAPIGNSAWGEAHQQGWIDGTAAYRDAIRALALETP